MSTKSYPSPLLPLLTPQLEPIVGDIEIPARITKKHNMQPNMQLKDIIGTIASELPSEAVPELADFIYDTVQSKHTVLLETAYKITDVPLRFDTLSSKISVRSTNALMYFGLTDSHDVSMLTMGELVSAGGLGKKGLLEILGAIYVITNAASFNEVAQSKLVVSRKLKQVATTLSRKRWSSKISTRDPRLGTNILSVMSNVLDMTSYLTAKEVGEQIKNLPLQKNTARTKKREINGLINKASSLTKLKLRTELSQIIDSIVQKPRTAQIIIARLGADGNKPQTLVEVGDSLGITRERVRQIESSFLEKLSKRLPVWTPVLDKAISLMLKSAPIQEKKMQKLLNDEGLVRGYYSVKSLLNIAKIFGKQVDILYDSKTGLVSTDTFHSQISVVKNVAIRLVAHWGAVTIDQLKDELENQGIKIADDQLRTTIELRNDLVWIDKKRGWFWLKDARKNRVLNYVEKILSVAGSIDLNDLRNGTGRWHRVHGHRLPKKVLLALCLTKGGYYYIDNKLHGDQKLPDWRSILSEGERRIVEILFDNNYVMRRSELEEKAIDGGLNRGSFYIYIGYSPVIERYAPGVYGLRGAPVTAAQIEAMIPPRLRKTKIFRDNGWTNDGNLWISFRLSDASVRSGVLGVPAALKRFISGSYRLVAETNDSVGTLTIRNGTMWGFSPFFRRWGVESGDYIVIEFNSRSKIATIYAGDQELITRYQDTSGDADVYKYTSTEEIVNSES